MKFEFPENRVRPRFCCPGKFLLERDNSICLVRSTRISNDWVNTGNSIWLTARGCRLHAKAAGNSYSTLPVATAPVPVITCRQNGEYQGNDVSSYVRHHGICTRWSGVQARKNLAWSKARRDRVTMGRQGQANGPDLAAVQFVDDFLTHGVFADNGYPESPVFCSSEFSHSTGGSYLP